MDFLRRSYKGNILEFAVTISPGKDSNQQGLELVTAIWQPRTAFLILGFVSSHVNEPQAVVEYPAQAVCVHG
jgi:hypothetical protein